MPATDGKRIGLKDIRSLEPGQTVWDGVVRGFGARRQLSKKVAFVLFYRTRENRQRWHTIGRHGSPWTPDQAREEAKRLLHEVAQGRDPAGTKQEARKGVTVAELCDLYLTDVEAGRVLTKRKAPKKVSTVASDRSRIERHVKPLLGRRPVAAVTRDDVEAFMHAVTEGETAAKGATAKGFSNVRGGRGTATRTVGLLGAVFGYAVRKKMRTDNPVRGIERAADGRRDRRLADVEYAAFGRGLAAAEQGGTWPPALAAARFLLLTGWRSGEALALRWSEIDLERRTARLEDTKSGPSMRPLSTAACEILRAQTMVGELAFPASRGGRRMPGFQWHFSRIVRLGGLPADVTPHVLRHSFASLAADLGYSEPTIAALIGHKGQSITSRYVHSADAVLLEAADAVAAECHLRSGWR